MPAIRNRPSITGYEWLWEAYLDLSTCRAIGMGAGPIPWTAVQRYAEVDQLGTEETRMLHGVIRHMDDVWLKHYNEKATPAKPKTPSRPRRSGSR